MPQSRQRLKKMTWLIGVAALLTATAVCLQFKPNYASYDGKTVTEWLGDLNSGHGPAEQRSAAALTSMGTNAVPELLSVLTRSDAQVRGIIGRLIGPKLCARLGLPTKDGRRMRAVTAFWLLGEQATSSIPCLVFALRTGHDPAFAARALA